MSRLPAASRAYLPAVPGMVSVSCVPNCLAPGKRWEGTAPALRTLAGIKADVCRMARVPAFWSAGGTMTLNGVVVPSDCWAKVTAKPGDRIAFVAAPSGKVANTILKVVGAIAATVAAIFIPGAQGLAAWGWGALLVGGMALTMAADYIAPIPMPSLSLGSSNDKAASPTYSLNASSNNMRYGQPIPRIYGRYKVPPVRILDDYTELSGQDEYLDFLSVIGYGPLEISDIRIGGNPLSNFSGVTTQVTQGWTAGEKTSLTPKVVYQNSYQIKLTGRDSNGNVTNADTWWVTRSIDHEIDRLTFDLQAPQGLYKLDDKAKKSALSVKIQAQYRVTGSSAWSAASEFTLKGSFAEPAAARRASYGWTVARGKYDVRVRLKEAESTDSKYIQQVYFTALRGFDNSAATDSGKLPLAKLAMRVKASNQLSGSLPVVTCLATSFIRDWDGSGWLWRATRNPASAFLDILTGTANERRKSDDQIDWESLQAWHEWCDKYGYTCDLVFDQQTSVWDALAEVAACGRGSAALMGGLWGAVWSRRQDGAPKGHITARNSRDFSSRKTYREPVHGLHVTFFDASNDYEETVIDVYAPGYNRSNASLFEGIDLIGITDRTQAAYMGQFRLNQLLHLPEEYSVTMPLEFMRLRKADKVRVVRPEVLYGIGAAILVDWQEDENGAVTALRWDSQLPMTPGQTYMAVVRLTDGGEFAVTGTSENGLNFRPNFSLTPSSPLKAMNLVMVGTVQEVGRECLVVDVKPQSNLTATVTMQDYIPELYENDGGEVPPYYAHTTLPGNVGRGPKAPSIVLVRSDEWALDVRPDGLSPRLYVAWKYEDDCTRARVEYRRADAQGTGDWMVAGTVDADHLYISDVEEGFEVENGRVVSSGVTYDVRVQAVRSGLVSAWATESGHAVIGRTTPPPVLEGLALTVQNPEGIKASWTPAVVKDFAKYALEGSVAAESAVESVMLKPYGKSGTLTERVYAVDVLGLRSSSAVEASVEVLPPAEPVPVYEVLPQTGMRVRWGDCTQTWSLDRYEVEDGYAGTSDVFKERSFLLSPRPAGQSYPFSISAVDVFGNRSTVVEFAVTVSPLSAPAPSAAIDGAQVVVSWPMLTTPFAVDHYEVQTQEGRELGKVKGTELRFLAPVAGTHGYKVRVVDIAGNVSGWGECALVIAAPAAPVVQAALEGDHVALAWTAPAADLPVVAYDVVRQWTSVEGIVQEEDYGRHDALALSVPALLAGTHTFFVRAVDNSGNLSGWGTMEFVAKAPGKVTFFDSGAVDNNVQLYYTEPDFVFFPIREFLVGTMEDGYELEIGRVDVHFFAEIRDESGQTVYFIRPVDIAGNIGERSMITIDVDQPPDYKLYLSHQSTFSGTKENLVLDGKGSMIGPVPEGETWRQNAERVAAIIGGTADTVTWQAKADAGFTHYFSPSTGGAARYQEVVDVRALIATARIVLSLTQETLEGAPQMTSLIEVSIDGADWTPAAENSLTVYASAFRYVRFTLEWTGGIVSVHDIALRVNVKRKTDFGRVFCAADDNGEGWASETETPMLTGTGVDFTTEFTAVQVGPLLTIADDPTGELTARLVFEGSLKPAGFRIYVKDKEGARASATVDWVAYGV